MARPDVVHLPLVDFHGNYGSPDFGPASAPYTECRLTTLGEAALAAERGELGALPITLINGDLHQGRRRPPLDPRSILEAIRAAVSGQSDDSIVEIVGLPSFPSRCGVTGHLSTFAAGSPSEIVASAAMVDGHEGGRSIVTITALPPFTSANRIGELVQYAVAHHAAHPAQCPTSPTNRPSARRGWSLSDRLMHHTPTCVGSSTGSRLSTNVFRSSSNARSHIWCATSRKGKTSAGDSTSSRDRSSPDISQPRCPGNAGSVAVGQRSTAKARESVGREAFEVADQ